MQSKATTPTAYLASLPPERRAVIAGVRKIFLDNLDKGYTEGMLYGMIGYSVPHSIYPDGYHCNPAQPLMFASIASQKNHYAIYMMCLYANDDFTTWFRDAWLKTGKKLDMGKSCIRFSKLEDLAVDVLAEAIRRVPPKKYIASYEAALGPERLERARRAALKASPAHNPALAAPEKKAAKKSSPKTTATPAKKPAAKHKPVTQHKAAKKKAVKS